MNKINPIFEALSGVDEHYIPTEKTKRPAPKIKIKKLRIALITAAAAAALILVVGFAANINNPNNVFIIDGTRFTFNVYKREVAVPEEYRLKDGESKNNVQVQKLPSELFAEFGVEFLCSDKFTEEVDFSPIEILKRDGVEYRYRYPVVGVDEDAVAFGYYLHNKSIDMDIFCNVVFYSRLSEGTSHLDGKPKFESVRLKDGSTCVLTEYGSACFAYNGAEYGIFIDTDDPYPGIEPIKQVIADLGILD